MKYLMVILSLGLVFSQTRPPSIGGIANIVGPRGDSLPASCTTDGMLFYRTGSTAPGLYVCQNGFYALISSPGPPPGATAVFMGDSITAVATVTPSSGAWANQFLAMSEGARFATSYNYAIPGYRISQVIAQYPTTAHNVSPAVTGKPGYFFLLIGANDINQGGIYTGQYMYDEISQIWALAKADGYTVVALTVFARGTLWDETSEVNRTTLDKLIRAARNTGVYDILVDTDALLTNPYDQTYFQADVTHPNIAGMTVIATAVNAAVLADASIPAIQTGSTLPGFANLRGSPYSMRSLTTGTSVTGFGFGAADAVTTGLEITAMGWRAGNGVTAASHGTYFGSRAGSGSTGAENVCVGFACLGLGTSTGAENVGVGNQTLNQATTGFSNVAVGHLAGQKVSTGRDNAFFGWNAGLNITTGSYNTILGSNAGNAPTTKNLMTAVGQGAVVSDDFATAIGQGTTASANRSTAIGAQAIATAIRAVQLGPGTNATADTLQYQTHRIADSSGYLYTLVATPATATATCTQGQFSVDASFFYACVAANTWVRGALTTW